MANEISVTVSLQITKGGLVTPVYAASFTDDMNGTARGGTPGLVRATTNGVDVSLTGLTALGYAWVVNLDQTNYVRLGLWDPDASRFRPVLRLKPATGGVPRPQLLCFDPDVEEEFISTGTGTGAGTDTNRIRLKANQAACDVQFFGFED